MKSEQKPTNRGFRWLYALLILSLIAYFSIEVKPLDQVKKGKIVFDAKSFASQFLKDINLDRAVDFQKLSEEIVKDKNKVFTDYSHAVAIGNIRYFLVKGEGKIIKITDDDVLLSKGEQQFSIATEFIYGSAIRDASGQFDLKKFPNSADVQALTNEINQQIRQKEVPNFRKNANVGDSVQFVGALEMNQAYPTYNHWEILPIKLNLTNQINK